MKRTLLKAGVVVIALGQLVMWTGVPTAQAAAIVVTSTGDTVVADSLCTLREAILNANADAATSPDCAPGTGADSISFSVRGTITLGSTLPPITGGLTLNGPGAATLAISGGGAVRVLHIESGATVALSGLTIQDSYLPFGDSGGGILNHGALTVSNSTFSGNRAEQGGAINNQPRGSLTVSNSTFSGNYADSGSCIFSYGPLMVSNSIFSGNSARYAAAAIANIGDLTVVSSTFSGNTAPNAGGILNMLARSRMTVTGSLFSGNSSSGSGAAIMFPYGSGSVNASCFESNIDSGSALDVNRTGGILTVDNNWWNTPTGPNTGGETTNIPVASFLTSRPACGAGAGGGTAGLCADGRLNCRFGDDYAIIYNAQDDHGHPSLHAYCVDAAGNGVLGMIVTPHDLEGIPPEPATTTLVTKADMKVCRTPVSFWVLTTGEYQVNIGPDYKGDLIRMIFDGLPPQGRYFKKCNVLTSFEWCGQ